jgi:hypothetical protein
MKRLMNANLMQLQEASYDKTTGELTVRVIQPGFNTSKKRYYPASTLKRDCKIFEGAKMFADHQTEAEQRAKPEGSVNNWVASMKNVWAENDGTIKGKAVVVDPKFKAKLETLAEKNLLGEMGISIRAVGSGKQQLVEGVDTNYVESLIAARSVDFVTYAGACGRVELMEADSNDADVDLIDEAQLRVRRPDLIQLIESAQGDKMKTVEQQLAEAQDTIKARDKQIETLNESTKAANKTAAGAELEKLLTESKLPDPAKARVRVQFKEAETTDGMKAAIDAEEAYIKAVGGTKSKNMGREDNLRESKEPTKEELIQAYVNIGMSESEAKTAAGA